MTDARIALAELVVAQDNFSFAQMTMQNVPKARERLERAWIAVRAASAAQPDNDQSGREGNKANGVAEQSTPQAGAPTQGEFAEYLAPDPTAAPAQQAYTTGHCKERAKKGGCQLHNLHCGYPECDRRPVAAPATPWPGASPNKRNDAAAPAPFRIVVDSTVPAGEIHFKQDGRIVGKIVDAAPAEMCGDRGFAGPSCCTLPRGHSGEHKYGAAPAQGEPRHLTRDEQQMLGRALRASAREVTAQGEPQDYDELVADHDKTIAKLREVALTGSYSEASDMCFFAAHAIAALRAERDEAHSAVDAWIDLLRASEAECEKLRADAERYRWLRNADNWTEEGPMPCVATFDSTIYGDALDAAIDAARAKVKP